jgi:hypothetical protein
MHTYRIEVSGGTVQVFYDGGFMLTGNTFSSAEFGSLAEIIWGDISNFADGTSEWEYVTHNSLAGRAEICDGMDNNCDGFVDDVPFACGAPWDTLVARPFTSAVPRAKALAFSRGGAYGRYMYVLSDYHDIYRVDSTGVVSFFGRTRLDNRANAQALVFDETTSQRYGGYLYAILDNTADAGTASGGIDRILPDGTAQVVVQGRVTTPRLLGAWDGVIDDIGRFGYNMFVSDFETDDNGSISTVIRVSPQAALAALGSGGLRGAMGLDLDRFGGFGGDLLVANPRIASSAPWWNGADDEVYRVAPDGSRSPVIPDRGLGDPMDVLVDALGRFDGDAFVSYGSLIVLYDGTGAEVARVTIPGASTIGLGQDRWGAFGYDVFCAIPGTNSVVRITPEGGAPPLSVETIFPRAGGDIGVVTALVRGTGFAQGATPKLVAPGMEILPTDVQPREEGLTLEARFDLRGQPRGIYDVQVQNPDGASATLADAFTIELGREPQIWVDIVGRDLIRVDRSSPYHIVFGNSGNVDAESLFVLTSFPSEATGAFSSTTVPFATDETEEGNPVLALSLPTVQAGSANVATLSLRTSTTSPFNLHAWVEMPEATDMDEEKRRRGDLCKLGIGLNNPACEQNRVCVQRVVSPCEENCTNIAMVKQHVLDVVTELKRLAEAAGFLCSLNPSACCDDGSLCGVIISGGNECDGHSCNPCGHTDGYKVDLRISFEDCISRYIIENPDNQFERVRDDRWKGLGCKFTLEGNHWDVECPPKPPRPGEVLCPPPDECAGKLICPGVSIDPNEKIGAVGIGTDRYVSKLEPLRYAVFFENQPTATAPAQEVVIIDQLDMSKLDLATLNLGPISFGTRTIVPLPGRQEFATDVDLRPETNLLVRIVVQLDRYAGTLSWRLTSIDPDTGERPEFEGFLPPNTNPPQGEGSVIFMVQPSPSLQTGEVIANSASIIFDTNDPIQANAWTNTIDDSSPISSVLPLPTVTDSTSFTVRWSGSDSGAGIQDYTIFVSDDGGPLTVWLEQTSQVSGRFTGTSGHHYEFLSQARDWMGLREVPKTEPDARTRVMTLIESTSALLDRILALLNSGVLNRGQANSLAVKIAAAKAALEKREESAAIRRLTSFKNEVASLISEGVLPTVEGMVLTDAATNLLTRIAEEDPAGNSANAAPKRSDSEAGALPKSFGLAQSTPNPFNPSTTIRASLPRASDYTLSIFDVAGRLVRRYIGSAPLGEISIVWDGRDDKGNSMGSGIYVYKLQAGTFTDTKRMVLAK